jgi:hypothetical protein
MTFHHDDFAQAESEWSVPELPDPGGGSAPEMDLPELP